MAGLSAQQELQHQLQSLAPALHSGAHQVADLRRLSGGASQETWSFDLRLDDGGSVPLILRRAPEGSAQRAQGNATLAEQAAILATVAATGVPVPAVRWLLQSEQDMGEGFIMQRIAGETLGRRIVAEPRLEGARAQLARQCGQALARIHRIAQDALPPTLIETIDQNVFVQGTRSFQ